MQYRLIHADVLAGLRQLADESVQCVVTSPPYWGLRDYGIAGQLGLEQSPAEYIAVMERVFAEVRRVLRKDGTLWLNIGDSYAGGGNNSGNTQEISEKQGSNRGNRYEKKPVPLGLKPKDLVGIPWMLAFALRADGWYLRSDIIWAKPNPMPESVTDRPTKAHEYLFLLTKSARYFYDAGSIAEPGIYGVPNSPEKIKSPHGQKLAKMRKTDKQRGHSRRHAGFNDRLDAMEKDWQCGGRNKRSVWTIATEPFPEAHFATFPTKLVEPCILAGSKPGDTILDPFSGSGTTGAVALSHQRNYIGIELNPEYVAMGRRRLQSVAPMFASEASE